MSLQSSVRNDDRTLEPAPAGAKRFPNVFIVGAPKCATTAMADYLAAHPQVAALPKEIHGFGRDLDIRRPGGRPSREAYAERADSLGTRAPLVLDASVFYLLSETAAREIHDWNPDARVIVMLRRPVDVMKSLHDQALKSLDEDIADFGAALAAEEDRVRGRGVPPGCVVVPALFYRRVTRFSEQIRRFKTLFPDDRIKIVVYDDFRRDPRGVYEEVCAFLGIAPDAAADLSPRNEAAAARVRSLVWFQKHVVHRFRLYGLAGRVIPKGPRRALWRLWRGLLYKPIGDRSVDPVLERALVAETAAEVEALETLIGRDLSAWRR